MMTWADCTAPCVVNKFSRSVSEKPYGRFPTYNFLATVGLLQKNHANQARPTAGGCRRMKRLRYFVIRGREKGRWEDNDEVITAKDALLKP